MLYNLLLSVTIIQMQMLVISTCCHMHGKACNSGILHQVYKSEYAHFGIAGIPEIGNMEQHNKNDKKNDQQVTGELYILISKKRNANEYISASGEIYPCKAPY